MSSPSANVQRAIRHFGSQEKLARAIDFSQNAVQYAKETGRVSARMAFHIHAATKGKISYVDLLDIKRALRRARKNVHINGYAR